MEPTDQFTDHTTALEARIAAAERALLAATGGANVCQLDKAGRATGGAKYHEGCLVALRAARRLAESGDAATLQAALRQLQGRWRADLQAQQVRERPSQPWLAYTQGGVDVLGELLAAWFEEQDA